MSDPVAPRSSSAVVLSPQPPSGRLAVLTAYAVAAAAIPLPFVPDRVIAQIRGSVAHDVAARHGVSLTSDARGLLADPSSEQRARLARAAETIARQLLRRVRGLGALAAASRGIEVYALGLLFERYLTEVRPSGAVRVQIEEARRVRDAIDRAVLRVVSPTLDVPTATIDAGVEDLRDEFTRWTDTFVLTSASLPAYLERRLIAAFDQVVRETPSLHVGGVPPQTPRDV